MIKLVSAPTIEAYWNISCKLDLQLVIPMNVVAGPMMLCVKVNVLHATFVFPEL
jgi:hypothetical protein